MRAAENLYENLWGQLEDFKSNLKVLSHEGVTWNYLSKEYLDPLQLRPLGYRGGVLLFREEYSVAVESFGIEEAMALGYRGVIITGQPGIGIVTVSLIVNVPLIITSSQENHVSSTICCFND